MAAYGMTLADGTEWTIPEAAQPSQTDYPQSIGLRDIFSGIKEVTSFALQTQQQLGAIQGAAETNSFNRFMASLALDTQKTVAQTQAETAKVQAQAALVKAQQAQAPATNIVSRNPGNTLVILAAVIGIVGVVYQISKGR